MLAAVSGGGFTAVLSSRRKELLGLQVATGKIGSEGERTVDPHLKIRETAMTSFLIENETIAIGIRKGRVGWRDA